MLCGCCAQIHVLVDDSWSFCKADDSSRSDSLLCILLHQWHMTDRSATRTANLGETTKRTASPSLLLNLAHIIQVLM